MMETNMGLVGYLVWGIILCGLFLLDGRERLFYVIGYLLSGFIIVIFENLEVKKKKQ